MKEAVETKCPGCGEEFYIKLETAYKDHQLTVRYELQPGHRMDVEDFGRSIVALAKTLHLTSKHLGARVAVQIVHLHADDEAVEITVAVAEVKKQ